MMTSTAQHDPILPLTCRQGEVVGEDGGLRVQAFDGNFLEPMTVRVNGDRFTSAKVDKAIRWQDRAVDHGRD
jgi:hypothetical protein